MDSYLHQIKGKSKKFTQLVIPTGHALLRPAEKILARYANKVCPVYCAPNWKFPHIIVSFNRCPHVSAKENQLPLSYNKHYNN